MKWRRRLRRSTFVFSAVGDPTQPHAAAVAAVVAERRLQRRCDRALPRHGSPRFRRRAHRFPLLFQSRNRRTSSAFYCVYRCHPPLKRTRPWSLTCSNEGKACWSPRVSPPHCLFFFFFPTRRYDPGGTPFSSTHEKVSGALRINHQV